MKKQSRQSDTEIIIKEVTAGVVKEVSAGVIKEVGVLIENLAIATAKGFEEQGQQIQELREDLHSFKKEMNIFKEETAENFGKIRKDIWALDDKFATKSEFNKFKLRLKME